MRSRILGLAAAFLFLSRALAAPAAAEISAYRIDEVVQYYVKAEHFMGAVRIARDAQVVFSKGYGFASVEWNVANSTNTKFRIGSVTKQFTAAAILLLEERGKLAINDQIRKYLPDAPAAWDKITIFHLLTHSSGIPDFTAFSDYGSSAALRSPAAQTVKRFRDKPLEFVPGAEMRYSNSGYVLLGLVIEKASGTSYAKFLDENIFKPLGMNDSGYDSHSALTTRRAAGYEIGPNGRENTSYIDMSIPFAAGALYSTVEDLHRWNQGLFGGKLLSAASLRKMTTPYKNNYALGLGIDNSAGARIFQHSGGINGFTSRLAYFPDTKMTVVVLANGGGPGGIVGKLMDIAQGKAVALPWFRPFSPFPSTDSR